MTYPTSAPLDWKLPPNAEDKRAVRLDVALAQRGLVRSRAHAQTLIKAGHVLVNSRDARQPSLLVSENDLLTVTGDEHGYVSRGGVKLAAALDAFEIDPAGLTCLDAGASTGGFTDCLLQREAKRVVAVDVGHGQMAQRLANDPRVDHREGVNVRHLHPQDFASSFDLIVADLSFISLRLVFPALSPLMAADGNLIALVKPQFEVGPGGLNKGGIVKDAQARQRALAAVQDAARSANLVPGATIESPIVGGDGNHEFLALFTPQGTSAL